MLDDMNKPTEGVPIPKLTEKDIELMKEALDESMRFRVDWRMWMVREYAFELKPYYVASG